MLTISGSSLLVAYATASKQLRTVRVLIRWGNKPTEKAQMPNPSQIFVSPTISVSHLAVANWMDVQPAEGSGFVSQSSISVLSHLVLLPPDGQTTAPTIMTVRSYLPTSPSEFNQNVDSVINRWELRESTQTIHPAFEQLGSRRGSTASQIPVSKTSP